MVRLGIIAAMSALIAALTIFVTSTRGETKFTVLHECVPTQSSNFTIWK